MESSTKWILGIGSAVVLIGGGTALYFFYLKPKWEKEKGLSGVPALGTMETEARPAAGGGVKNKFETVVKETIQPNQYGIITAEMKIAALAAEINKELKKGVITADMKSSMKKLQSLGYVYKNNQMIKA